MKRLHRVGKFYTRIIINNIGIFIFIGLLSVVFHDHGWFPNEDMYAISQLVYRVILPAFIAYEGGKAAGGKEGGIAAALAAAGLIYKDSSAELFGAMILGPVVGLIWKKTEAFLQKSLPSSMQMLAGNLALGITGGVAAAAGIYLFLPLLERTTAVFFGGISFLSRHGMTVFFSLFIEPAKVFFLNNIVNHMMLIPLGMEQLQETGSSVLFLLETNPGPGAGILLALFYRKQLQKNQAMSLLTAHALGGIHEVYFPFVLADLRLLLPLILGGMAGNLCFLVLNAGLAGVVSPGSVFTVFLMAGAGSGFRVLIGILLSACVSFLAGCLILKKKPETESHLPEPPRQKENEKIMERPVENPIKKIAFVCDGGMGSSVMGAALLRRRLGALGISEVTVEAFAVDLVPGEVDLVVCQKDFYQLHGAQLGSRKVHLVDSLLQPDECMVLFQKPEEGEMEG